MIRIASLVLLLAALSGCSVFGVATKSELETALQQEAVQQKELEARLAELDDKLSGSQKDLALLDQQLRPQLAAHDSALAATDAKVAAATQHQARLVAHIDSLRTEYVTLDRDVDVVRQGMTTVTARAAKAQADSRQAIQIQYESLLDERDQLQRQLEALDQRLQTWPVPADTVVVPDGIAAAAEPAPSSEAGKIDIRVVTPEEPASGGS